MEGRASSRGSQELQWEVKGTSRNTLGQNELESVSRRTSRAVPEAEDELTLVFAVGRARVPWGYRTGGMDVTLWNDLDFPCHILGEVGHKGAQSN